LIDKVEKLLDVNNIVVPLLAKIKTLKPSPPCAPSSSFYCSSSLFARRVFLTPWLEEENLKV